MPRPRVSPSNRQRTAEACEFCKAAKRKCSSHFPCSYCVRRGRAAACTSSKLAIDSTQEVTITQIRSTAANPLTSSPYSSASMPQMLSNGPGYPIASQTSPEAQHQTHPRMLRNLQGENVFIGGGASLSFLQLIRDTVSQHIGPSRFSHNTKSDKMLETETDLVGSPTHIESSLNVQQKLALVQVYHIATCGMVNLFNVGEAEDLVRVAEIGDNSLQQALVDLILAIGAQSQKKGEPAELLEKFYFARGQRMAFSGMLEDASLDLIQVMLLMAFYLLGACRRNSAFLYLGLATQAAVTLGLHTRASYSSTTPVAYQKRLRILMSLSILDLLVSQILGRPSATSILRSEFDGDFINNLETASIADISFMAAYRMTGTIDEMSSKLYGRTAASVEEAERLIQKLKQWSDELPDSLRSTISLNNDQIGTHTLGKINISCLYYFTVTLITRPFLISTLTARLSNLQNDVAGVLYGSQTAEDPAHAQLASACVDSALYLVQTCRDGHKAGLLLENMSIIKALVFAAGLILGFAMFAKREVDFEIEDAFAAARDIQQFLSTQSPQAAEYLEILTMLADAITEQRHLLASQTVRSSSRYVRRLVSLDMGRRPSLQTPVEADVNNLPTTLAVPAGVSDTPDMTPQNESEMFSDIPQNMEGDPFLGWDSLYMPLWDSFPFISEPFILPT